MASDGPLAARASLEEFKNDSLIDADLLEDACERTEAVDVPLREPDCMPMVVTKFASDAASALGEL